MAKSHTAIISQRCKKITSDIAKINDYIHETGMLIVRHAAPEALNGHHDCDTALMLSQAMPKSYRRTMLVEWFRKYTPIVVKLSDNGDKVGFDPKYKKLDPKDKATARRPDGSLWWDIESAESDPFFSIADRTPEEKTYTLEELLKMVHNLGGRIEKLIDKGEIPETDLEGAQAIVSGLEGFKVAPKAEKPEDAANVNTVKRSSKVAPEQKAA